jgi:predicted transcriptional regulator
MNPPSGPHPRQRRYSVRQQARLDAETHAKLEALATALHRKRAQVLRHVMQ